MKRMVGLALFALMGISLFGVDEAFGGAWTVPKYRTWGEYYMKWSYSKQYFPVNGHKKQLGLGMNAREWDFTMEPKIEFGVTDWLTFLWGMEYKELHYKEYGRPPAWGAYARKNHGITNVKLGTRWRWTEKPVVFSLQTKVFIYPGYGIYHGDDGGAYANQPSLGYGDDAVEERVMVGKKINFPITEKFVLPIYWGMETGYRWRTRHVCGDVPYFVEAGFWPCSWLLVKSELDGYMCNPGTGSIKESYGTWRIGGVWQVFGDSVLREGDKMFNIEFQYGMTLWGKNTTAYNEWVLKVQTQF
jgi:hypothetical protein